MGAAEARMGQRTSLQGLGRKSERRMVDLHSGGRREGARRVCVFSRGAGGVDVRGVEGVRESDVWSLLVASLRSAELLLF